MSKGRIRTLLRIVGFAVIMTVAPVAFGATGDAGLQINDACADGGGCCYEYGSLCGGMAHRGMCDLP